MSKAEDSVRRKLVLVIDDNEAERKLYGGLLWYNGFDVSLAVTGEDGLRLAHDQSPDLILLDMMLPGINGVEVCKTLKSDPRTSDAPVIALSGRPRNEMGTMATRAGCVQYLEKPISPINVLFEIERLIGRAA